jgi:hypothetical protein
VSGELAQYFALATYGSAWLQGRLRSQPARLTRMAGSFRFVDSVDFAGVVGVGGWLERLSAQEVDRVWLAAPDLRSAPQAGEPAWHLQAAFGGGVAAGVLTTSSSGNELWRASWDVVDGSPAARPWKLSYGSTRVTFGPDRVPVEDAAAALDAALARAAAFAARLDLKPWDSIFATARLHWSDPAAVERPRQRDLFPARCYGRGSRRLVAMAQAAWVFGGMGSWNDLWLPPDSSAEYDEISRELYATVVAAHLASANADL